MQVPTLLCPATGYYFHPQVMAGVVLSSARAGIYTWFDPTEMMAYKSRWTRKRAAIGFASWHWSPPKGFLSLVSFAEQHGLWVCHGRMYVWTCDSDRIPRSESPLVDILHIEAAESRTIASQISIVPHVFVRTLTFLLLHVLQPLDFHGTPPILRREAGGRKYATGDHYPLIGSHDPTLLVKLYHPGCFWYFQMNLITWFRLNVGFHIRWMLLVWQNISIIPASPCQRTSQQPPKYSQSLRKILECMSPTVDFFGRGFPLFIRFQVWVSNVQTVFFVKTHSKWWVLLWWHHRNIFPWGLSHTWR